MPETITCEICGRTLPTERPDADAVAEAEKRSPRAPADDMPIVCDECLREWGDR